MKSTPESKRVSFQKFAGMKRAPNQQRGDDRVAAILDATERLLEEKSVEDLSLDEIVKLSQVSKGTIYHFFDDKQSVFMAMMHRSLLELNEQSVPRPSDDLLSTAEFLVELEQRLAEFCLRHQSILMFYLKNRFRWDFSEQEEHLKNHVGTVLIEEICKRNPTVARDKAHSIALFLMITMSSCQDSIAYLELNEAEQMREHWREMIPPYLKSQQID